MTREIKFRVFCKIFKKMYYEFATGSNEVNLGVNKNLERFQKNENWEIMQFTGLFDKNGKEIFEGDILKYQFSYSLGFTNSVIYSNSGFYIDDKCDRGLLPLSWITDNAEPEVVGNIYENLKNE